jgi:hypothetical protein
LDRPRPGRPPKMTCELARHLQHLVEQDPLQHGARSSQWSCRELATRSSPSTQASSLGVKACGVS